MEPSANPCAGFDCERYRRGRLIRGMCPSHYNGWLATSTTKRKIPPRPKAVGCTVEGCDVQLIQGRGWCAKHYSRWKNHGDPNWEPPAPREGCEADGCDREHYSLGYCVMHYSRLKTHGDVTVRLRQPLPDICAEEECTEPAARIRWCIKHHGRMVRLGTTTLPPRPDRHVHSMGYQIVKRPEHPVATRESGWVYEHRVVLYDEIGPGWHPCHHCQAPVSWELTYPESPDALVVDHLDEDRANNDLGNLVPSCAPCNFQRSSRWVKREREAG